MLQQGCRERERQLGTMLICQLINANDANNKYIVANVAWRNIHSHNSSLIKVSKEVRSPEPKRNQPRKWDSKSCPTVPDCRTLQRVNRMRPHLLDEFLIWHSGCRLIQSLSPSINSQTQPPAMTTKSQSFLSQWQKQSQCQIHWGWFHLIFFTFFLFNMVSSKRHFIQIK